VGKKVEVDVVCPDCGLKQKYHSYKSNREIRGSRRKKCNKCGRSFKVSDQRASKFRNNGEPEKKRKGFFKYTKSD